ncbi:antioxidant, AhpC/TSA family [Verrucomicrobiia bacterium DG1235]|nr:antioxidant, AhpC/TSA family [Verrucomicrobiae bacterium DG1235]
MPHHQQSQLPFVPLCASSWPKKPYPTLFLLLTLLLSLFTLSPSLSAQRYVAGDIVENFTLTDRATGEPVSLSDFEGKIVFLEWFAYWCPFCQAAADQTESGIVSYYNSRQGNPAGIPVIHVALNLQADAESLTQDFIDTYNLGLVLNDFDRAISNKFQAANQPIFAIINGVANSPSHQQWELLHTSLGYLQTVHPITTFRAAIDAVQAAPNLEPPAFTLQPAGTNLATGETLQLSVQATGDDLTYQWRKNGNIISEQTSAQLSIQNVTLEESGSYTVTISNEVGELTSEPAVVTIGLSLADYLASSGLTGNDAEASADPDFDGHSNVFEYLGQSDPNNSTSQPSLVQAFYVANEATILDLSFTISPDARNYTAAIQISPQANFEQATSTIPASENGSLAATITLLNKEPPLFARFIARELP